MSQKFAGVVRLLKQVREDARPIFSGRGAATSKAARPIANQGCQTFNYKTKNPNLGIFWRALEWKLLVCISYDRLE
jgi:hypothetical protein